MTVELGGIDTWRLDLAARLSSLDRRRTAAFAATCAERLLPYYKAFEARTGWGDADALRQAVDLTWEFTAGTELDKTIANSAIARCDKVTPDTEDFEDDLVSRALDAATTAAGALTLANGGPLADVVVVAETTLDAAFGLAQAAEPSENLATVFRGPLVQDEVERQYDTIGVLASSAPVDREHLLRLGGRWPSPSDIGRH